jgi:hypothetical protein
VFDFGVEGNGGVSFALPWVMVVGGWRKKTRDASSWLGAITFPLTILSGVDHLFRQNKTDEEEATAPATTYTCIAYQRHTKAELI